MQYLFLGVLCLVLLFFIARAFSKADPKKLARFMRQAGGIVSLVLAAVLLARGLFPLAIPLGLLGFSLLGQSLGLRFPGISPGAGRSQKSAGQRSAVRTATLEMELDHDSGSIEGRVLRGRYAGRAFDDMDLTELLDLMAECARDDPQGAQLLQAYLDRQWPEWRDRVGEGFAGQEGGGGAPSGGRMTREEAYEVLGLAPGASEDDIRKAHRTLMKRFHPDQGGSTYLATKINEAKDVLLGL